jgi:hypothetical protein
LLWPQRKDVATGNRQVWVSGSFCGQERRAQTQNKTTQGLCQPSSKVPHDFMTNTTGGLWLRLLTQPVPRRLPTGVNGEVGEVSPDGREGMRFTSSGDRRLTQHLAAYQGNLSGRSPV